MSDLRWFFAGLELTGIIACGFILIALHKALRLKRPSSNTRCMYLFGALTFAVALRFVVGLMRLWWPDTWLESGVRIAIALLAIFASLLLVRLIPRAIAFHDRDYLLAAAEDLRQSKLRFERALEGSSNGLWEYNVYDQMVWFSSRFRELLGYTDEKEFPNTFQSWSDALHPLDKEHFLAALEDHLQGQEVYDVENRLRTKSGEYRWFNARGLAIRRQDGTPYLMSGSIQDIHERKIAQQTLRQMEEYTSQKHKMESLGELAGGIAHEFNNMLQAIGGQIHLAECDLVESEAKNELAIASKLIEQASHVSRRLLTFSRHGGSRLEPQNPNDVLVQFEAILRPMLKRRVTLKIIPGAGLGRVVADAISLQQALMNLSINARDATPEGGSLTISTARAEISDANQVRYPVLAPGAYVTFSVKDTGCGVSEELRLKIFEPFFTTKAANKGTGLGLAIVNDIVREHRGLLELESQPGIGSTFRIWLPAVEPAAERSGISRCLAKQDGRKPRATILYAEDEKPVRRVTKRLLQSRGFRVVSARNGAAAVRVFDRSQQKIDLALLDVDMPELNGVRVFQHIRGMRPQLPVIFCSAHATELYAENILEQENTQLIDKPYFPDTLWRALDGALIRVSSPGPFAAH